MPAKETNLYKLIGGGPVYAYMWRIERKSDNELSLWFNETDAQEYADMSDDDFNDACESMDFEDLG